MYSNSSPSPLKRVLSEDSTPHDQPSGSPTKKPRPSDPTLPGEFSFGFGGFAVPPLFPVGPVQPQYTNPLLYPYMLNPLLGNPFALQILQTGHVPQYPWPPLPTSTNPEPEPKQDVPIIPDTERFHTKIYTEAAAQDKVIMDSFEIHKGADFDFTINDSNENYYWTLKKKLQRDECVYPKRADSLFIVSALEHTPKKPVYRLRSNEVVYQLYQQR